MEHTFHVTKEMIRRSTVFIQSKMDGARCKNCPVALALNEKFPGSIMTTADAYLLIEGKNRRIRVPNHVGKFVIKFDKSSYEERLEMEDISFSLEV